MDLSLFFEIETADTSAADVKRCYDECIEQVMLADELGSRTAWFLKRHFIPFLSYCTAPEMVLAHLAAKARKIRLGHGIVLRPFNVDHPVRVAETIAAPDLLCNGRAGFGGGRSTTDAEPGGFSIDPEVARLQWDDSLRALPRMRTEDRFQWDPFALRIQKKPIVPTPYPGASP